jgi:hypothetical protein
VLCGAVSFRLERVFALPLIPTRFSADAQPFNDSALLLLFVNDPSIVRFSARIEGRTLTRSATSPLILVHRWCTWVTLL